MPITDTANGTQIITHIGVVLYLTTKVERIMSDVYADVTYAVVWDSLGQMPAHVRLFDNEFGGDKEAQVDATPTVLQQYVAWQDEQELQKQAQDAAARESGAMDRVLAIRVGATIMAIHGRKIKTGTVGVCDRLDMNGTRICFRDSTTNNQTWSDTSNFGRIDRCLPDGKTWSEYENDLLLSESKVDFNKGDRVKIKSSGRTGIVFWKKDGRFGVTPGQVRDTRTGQYTDALWVSVGELEYAL